MNLFDPNEPVPARAYTNPDTQWEQALPWCSECQGYHHPENPTCKNQPQERTAFDRMADALERIADALEGGDSHVLTGFSRDSHGDNGRKADENPDTVPASGPKKPGEFQKLVDELKERWNAMAEGPGKKGPTSVRTFGDKDKRNLRNRIKDEKQHRKCTEREAFDAVLQTLDTIPEQAFACGRVAGSRGKWRISLQSFLTAKTYSKVANNEYSSDEAGTTKGGRVRSGRFLAGRGKKGSAGVGTT